MSDFTLGHLDEGGRLICIKCPCPKLHIAVIFVKTQNFSFSFVTNTVSRHHTCTQKITLLRLSHTKCSHRNDKTATVVYQWNVVDFGLTSAKFKNRSQCGLEIQRIMNLTRTYEVWQCSYSKFVTSL